MSKKSLVEDVRRLSPTQAGILFHCLAAPDSGVYLFQVAGRLEALDLDAFVRAWQTVVDRHSVLRTAFVWEKSDQPVQVVGRQARLPITRFDWRTLSTAVREERFDAHLEADRQRGFKLNRPPLMRLALMREGEQDWRFLWTAHHLVLDGWSLALLLREVMAAYQAHAAGTEPVLAPVRPYRDYLVWLERRDLEPADVFWRRMLAGFTAPTPLGVERATGRSGPGAQQATIAEAAAQALRATARRRGLTIASLIGGAWALVLSDSSGEDDIVFGLATAGRPPELEGAERMIGLFVNTLPVRVRIERRRPLARWLTAYQEQQAELREFEHTPLVRLQRLSEVPAGVPLFESLLAIEDFLSIGAGPSAGLPAEPDAAFGIAEFRSREQSNYPLALTVAVGTGLGLRLDYDCSRFDATTTARLLGRLCRLLSHFAGDLERWPTGRELLAPAEGHQLLSEWNDSARGLGTERVFHRLFAAQAARTPERVAAIGAAGWLSYGELDRRADRLAGWLARHHVGVDAVVALLADRGLDFLVAVLAIWKTGAAYLPLDPRHPVSRQRQVLHRSRSRLALGGEKYLSALAAAAGELSVGERPEVWALETATTSALTTSGPASPAMSSSPALPQALAYTIFTSGSTGVPKGAMVAQVGMVNHLWAKVWDLALEATDLVAQTASQCFDISVWQFFSPLLVGGGVRVYDDVEVRSPVGLFARMARHRVTVWETVPSLLQAFLTAREVMGERSGNRALRWLLTTGETLPPDLASRWCESWPAVPLLNAYGPTECSDDVTHWVAAGASGEHQRIPLGRPLVNLQIRVLDRWLEPVAIRVSGELCVGGIGVGRGYLHDPRRTAEVFIPDPWSTAPGGRLYRTGDLARFLADGEIDFLGRRDHQVKVRGFRIELGEIDNVLRRHPQVHEAVTVVQGDAAGRQRLVAFVVAAGNDPDGVQLRAFVQERLPDYMVPAAFIALDALPLTANRKIDRNALVERAALLHSGRGEQRPASVEVAARTPAEQTLLEIWRQVLGTEQVGLHDNFFELGGDSILSIQVVSRARRAGLALGPEQLFEHPTLAELAVVAAPLDAPATSRVAAAGDFPLTPIQRWFFAQELGSPWHWNQSLIFGVDGRPSAKNLRRAVEWLVAYHDALRLRFHQDARGPSQRFARPGGGETFTWIDHSRLVDAGPARARAATVLQASLDLERGPLARFAFFEGSGAGSGRLLCIAHHLVVDGVSWRILLEDLQQVYAQLERGEQPRLLEQTSSFSAWARSLQEAANAPELAAEVEFWTPAARDRVRSLPVDDPAGANLAGSVETVVVELTSTATRHLLTHAPAVWRTQINDLLLTALARAHRRWAGSPVLLVELEGHGRETVDDGLDLARTVGWCTALFPLVLELPEDSDSIEQLKAVKEQLRALPRRGIGWGLLRYLRTQDSAAERLRRLAPPQVRFNYLGQLDRAVTDSPLLGASNDAPGRTRAASDPRPYLLEIDAAVIDGRLRATWTYSSNLHHRTSVEAFAEAFRCALAELAERCLDERSAAFTPADFPLAGLDLPQLETLVQQVGRVGSAPAAVQDVYRLAPAQEGIFFHTLRAHEASGTYFLQLACRLEGELDSESFAQAWRAVIARQPTLRTAFFWAFTDRPVQVVYRQVDLPLTTEDWRAKPPTEQEQALDEALANDRRRGFDLTRPPLVRLRLIRLGAHRWAFVCSLHHLLMDGWSVALVLREVLACYQALVRGRVLELGPVRPYRAHIAWLERQDLAAAEAFWRRSLAGFTAPLALPADPALVAAGYGERRHGAQRDRLPATAGAALRRFAQGQKLTLATVVEAAWAVLLARWCATTDVVFGSAVSGRSADLPGIDETVGLFINTLPVRAQIDPAMAIEPWLQRFQTQLAAMRRFEHTPLVAIQSWSELPRGTALFETLFVFENYPLDRALDDEPGETPDEEAGELRVERIWMEERNNYPLTLMVVPGGELQLQLLYDAARFSITTARRWLGHLCTLLEALGSGAADAFGELPLLTAAERQQLVWEWNDTRMALPEHTTLYALFERQAALRGEGVAVGCDDRWLSYGELARRAEQLAGRLAALGVGPEVRVAVALERSPEMVVALLAVLAAGGAYVPLDPGYPAARLAQVFSSAAPAVLLTAEALLGGLPVPPSTHVLCLDDEVCAVPTPEPPTARRVAEPENLAYVIYTSGSTGKPKGVQITHRSLVNFLAAMALAPGLAAGERLLAITTLAFDIAGLEIFLPLTVGGTVDLALRPVANDGLRLAARLATARPAAMQATPAGWRMLLEADWAGDPKLAVLCGGEALLPALAAQLQERGCGLWNLYGPTETTIWSAVERVVSKEDGRGVISIGRPLANTSLYIVDAHGRPLSMGMVGELVIGGDGLCRGYLGRPTETALRLIPDALGDRPGARLYRTGDQARWLADGRLDFLGRADHQVKVRGFRIELGEIETALECHPGIGSVVVVARGGRDEQRLVAYLLPVGTAVPTPSAMRAFLAQRLPAYMVPATFVALASFPLTPNGKIDRKALAQEAPAALPSPAHERVVAAPRNPFEEALVDLWCEVLELEEVGIHDDFFVLGGHSLLATRVVARLRRMFTVELGLEALFASPTVAALAARVEAALSTGSTPVAPSLVSAADAEPVLSFAQERFWVLDQLEPGSAVYNVPVVVELSGHLEVAALAAALGGVIRRHQVLRASFPAVAGRPMLRFAPAAPSVLPLVDLSALAEPARRDEEERLLVADARRGFDLGSGPLVRATLLRTASERHVCLLTLHHAVCDDWSMGLLVSEVAALYHEACEARPSPLEPLPIQYVDWARWQRGWLRGEVLEALLAGACRALAEVPALQLPSDRPAPAVADPRGRSLPVVVPEPLADKLRELARAHGATLYMGLASALQVLLARWSGQQDFCLGTPLAGRSRAEAEALIGCFVNTLVLRTELAGDPGFEPLLRRVRGAALAAYARQDLPFEKLVDALESERSRDRPPLFQVAFVLQNAPRSTAVLPGLRLAVRHPETGQARYPLSVVFRESREGPLHGLIEYQTALFDATTIARLACHLEVLLAAALAAPRARASTLPLLTPHERHQLLAEWRLGESAQTHASIHELIAAQAARTPAARAVVCGARELSYRELDRQADRFANRLRVLGVTPEVRVAVCAPRAPEWLVAALGVLKAGGVWVPLDPDDPPARLGLLLEQCGAKVLVRGIGLVSEPPASIEHTLELAEVGRLTADRPSRPPAAPVRLDHLAYVIFTSGSTGKPKGVMVAHRALVEMVLWRQATYGLGAGDAVLHAMALGCDPTVWDTLGPLASGAAVVMPEPGEERDPARLAALIRDHGVTLLQRTPATLTGLLDASEEAGLGRLRTVLSGGDPIPLPLRDRFDARCGGELYNLYGPTEAVLDAAGWRCRPRSPRVPIPIGRPVAGNEAHVLDAAFNPLPIGVAGELCLGGSGLARGYLGRPARTAAVFVPDPWSCQPGGRLYRTGDQVRYGADGALEFGGRIDDQVKVRGFRIELGEVEAQLARHPALGEVVVVVRADGGTDKRLVAYFVVRGGEVAPTSSALRAFVRTALPEPMVPAVCVELEALPRTAVGKIDRRALPAPDAERLASEILAPPQTAGERTLAAIWCRLLGLTEVGIYDNFFELGGDSISSLRIVHEARRAGLGITARQIFEQPTIAALAAAAATAGAGVVDAEQGAVVGEVPLTPVQWWFFEQSMRRPEHWNQSVFFELLRPLDPALLHRVLAVLMAHHDALRLRFERGEEGWRQRCAPVGSTVPFAVIDLGRLSADGHRRQLEDAAARVQASLDLARGPLLRAVFFTRGAERSDRLLIVAHHLVVDGVSWRILLEDLHTGYDQLIAGLEEVELAPKTTSFKAWAERLAAHAASGALIAETAHWTSTPRGRRLVLPTDRDGSNTFADALRTTVALDEELTRMLLQEATTSYRASVEEMLLAALGLGLGQWLGAGMLRVDLEGHGREEVFADVELARTVGWFTTIYPVDLELDPTAEPAAVLRAVKERLRAVPGRGLGYGLARYLGPEDRRVALGSVASEVSFNYFGQFDHVLPGESPLRLAAESAGPDQELDAGRPYMLSVNANVSGGRLRMTFEHSRQRCAATTLQALAEACRRGLARLLEGRHEGADEVLTPSDFPEAAIDADELANLLLEVEEAEMLE